MLKLEQIPWTTGNQLKLFQGGNSLFPALVAAIEAAERSIFLETYIFAKDATTQTIATALERAAQRGVQVHVLVDGFGTRNFVADFGESLSAARVRFLVYRPELTTWRLRRSRLRRLHRKLAVIDKKTAFVGGINIIDDNNCPPQLAPRFDFAVQVTGAVAEQIHHAALREWMLVARSGFQAHLHHFRQHWLLEYRRLRQRLSNSPRNHTDPVQGQVQVRFLPRDNARHRSTIADAYLGAIASAQNEIFLAHAYFFPGYRFRRALLDARQRGVQVKLLLQGHTDHPLLQYATRALYGNLLEGGIELYEFTGGFLHAKVGIVDQHWATVGSSNIDPFSLSLAHEGNLEIRDPTFTHQLGQALQTAVEQQSVQITLEQLKHAGWLSRANRWLAYGLVRLLINFAGYGARRGME